MIQPLRTVHRRVSVALALILPSVLAIGLMARQALPRQDQSTSYSEALHSVRQSDHVWTKHTIHSSFFRSITDPTTFQIVLEPVDELSGPDVLVYWSPQESGGESFPSDAVLLGPFGNRKPLLLRGSQVRGVLILYSPAHHSVVDTAPLESMR